MTYQRHKVIKFVILTVNSGVSHSEALKAKVKIQKTFFFYIQHSLKVQHDDMNKPVVNDEV